MDLCWIQVILLCSTPQKLTEEARIGYILQTLYQLGPVVHYIREIRAFVYKQDASENDAGSIAIFYENSLSSAGYNECCQTNYRIIQPMYLVHEFIPSDGGDWDKKIYMQQHALGGEDEKTSEGFI